MKACFDKDYVAWVFKMSDNFNRSGESTISAVKVLARGGIMFLAVLSSPQLVNAQDLAPTPSAVKAEVDAQLTLGVGDSVNIDVYGQPQLKTTTYVADDGTVAVPLAGPVQVKGLSPSAAGLRVAEALRAGQFLINPQVNITLSEFRSQQISVLGQVQHPGRFPIQSKTTVFDMLALAGGVNDLGADVVYILRPGNDGQTTRFEVDLGNISDQDGSATIFTLKAGDSIFVPRAKQFFLYGEVHTPNAYRYKAGMTVLQALALGGGVTDHGSDSRVEIKRKGPDGKERTISVGLSDPIQADDVVRVKERIF